MRGSMTTTSMTLKIALMGALLGAAGCTCNTRGSVQQQAMVEPIEVYENNVHGTVTKPWTEPMYDTVKVPGQIDPKNIYYIPNHQTVVEIRPERYRNVTFDGDRAPVDERNYYMGAPR